MILMKVPRTPAKFFYGCGTPCCCWSKELDISFDAEPKSLKRGGAGKAKSGGRTKLSRAKKNEILERMDMKYYLSELSAGTKTMDDITAAITEAFKEKTEWEEKGWVFVEGKTKYPEYKGEEE